MGGGVRGLKVLAIAIGGILALSPSAKAESSGSKPWYMISEVLVGGGADDPFSGHETSAILSEARLQPIGRKDWFFFFRPRPHFGFNANLEGKTSVIYTGLTWDIFEFRHITFGGEFGFAVHDGRLHKDNPDLGDRKLLGSREEFHEGFTLGYRFTSHYGVEAWLDHISNAGIFDKTNQGLETAGIKLSIRY
jgi:hypothetical protein